ncbi:MAG TPA: hypothetical protein VNN72_18030, partial [Polyangiaceae bacterium]|nr:hypothetical protein [Polyangiaceae bacterium]
CSRNEDCCSSTCTKAVGATVGTCDAPPSGPSRCGGVDGVVCDGCNDCCSRVCAPGPTARTICQPASGCHVTGDLCRKDSDCCGGDPDADLPGAGNVTCEIEPGKVIGICRNPMSCSPQGNVCHYKDEDFMCNGNGSSAPAKCCDGLGAQSDACQLDALGVPRCYAIDACRAAGETCASAADCCDGVPCVPDSAGVLRCADVPPGGCVMSGGSCTIDGDCCPGTTCIRAPGSTDGVCSTPTTGTGGTGGTGGTTGGSSGAGGTAAGTGGTTGGTGGTTGGTGGTTGGTGGTTGGTGGTTGGTGGTGATCAAYGQSCTSVPCCNAVPCNGGICRYFTP